MKTRRLGRTDLHVSELSLGSVLVSALGQPADVQDRDLDLETDTPYNSRIGLDLPPTPIAAPGRASATPRPGPLATSAGEPGAGSPAVRAPRLCPRRARIWC